MKVKSKLLGVVLASLVFVMAAFAAVPTPFFQGFESDTAGWFGFGGTITRVPSSSNGIASADGSWHAEVDGGAFTRWGAYSDTFPLGGFITSIDVFLDMDCPQNDTKFDWSSAISNTSGGHRRDFIFSGGCYTDAGPYGSGNRFVFTVSNNAPGWPRNPTRDPFAVYASGWYTLQHRFYDSGSGVLAVDHSILDSAGNALKTWTLSNPTDIIGTTVGGNQYGWLIGSSNQFPFLAIDNTELRLTPPDEDADGVPDADDNCPGTAPGTVVGDTGCPVALDIDTCKRDGWKNLYRQDGSPFKNQGDCIQYVNTGK